MCGFCGFTGNSFNDENNTVINKMTERIAHRGPDGLGFYIDQRISLGFRRLSFLDIEQGSQPMTKADKTIVYNGEIYNFRELKEELTAKGITFTTTSDTEVILALYDMYQEKMLTKLRGMFAFLIYDHKTGEIFAARDYFGIKPFYYGIFNNQFLFASEIKAFLDYPDFVKELNQEALSHYLSFQFSATDATFFNGVYKLPPAHTLRYKDNKIEISRYWQAEFKAFKEVKELKKFKEVKKLKNLKKQDIVPLHEIVDKIDQKVKDSVAYHQVADVPIGCFLSSGVDSSYVAALFNGQKTFTVGFDYEGYDESQYAKNLSKDKGIDNYSKIIKTEEYWDSLGKIQYHMDEPLADPAAVALYFVSKLAREHVKGVLSGEGADELFGGYGIYREPLHLAPVTALPLCIRRLLGKIASKIPNIKGRSIKGKNFFIRASQLVEERYIGNAKIFDDKEKEQIFKGPKLSFTEVTKPFYDKVPEYDDITKMQYLDIHLWMVGDILLKADKMSMANSLESRVPFLDKEVFSVAAEIPTKYRVKKKYRKYAFRLAAGRTLKPQWAKKKKLGFPVPVKIWLREEKYYNIVKTAFMQDFVKEYFHVENLIKLMDDHKSGIQDNSRKIWTVYIFVRWYKEFF